MKNQIIHTIQTLKQQKFGTVLIPGNIKKTRFQLVLLTLDCSDNAHIIRLLARWRKKHETWFPAQFPVTYVRTKEWLRKRVLHEPDRLLFMIQVHDTYIGHVGLYRFEIDLDICEIDNIVRGRIGYPGIIKEAIIAMTTWGRSQLDLKGYTLQTTSDNEKSLKLYKSLGFAETKRVPLVYAKTPEGGQWGAVPNGYNKHIKRYDVFMKQEVYETAKAK